MNDLQLALTLADAADAVSMDRFQAADLIVETKPDMTPVSDADRAVEQAIRSVLADHRPDDAVHGEEFGAQSGDRVWIIDPIDGTKSFVRGVPIWATLIALKDGNDVTTGVVSAPALGRRWWASNSQAFTRAPGTDGDTGPLQVSNVGSLVDASFGFSDAIGWPPGALERLLAATWRQRGYGDFWSHLMVAEGVTDIACEPALKVHDVAALIPIVHAAGGRITTFDGAPVPLDDPDAEFSAVTTNGALHNLVVDLLQD